MACWVSRSFHKYELTTLRKGGRNDLMYVWLEVHQNVRYRTIMDENAKVAK